MTPRGTQHIARCPEHGLHGARADCHTCGGPVEQVPMVELADLIKEWAVATVQGTDAPVLISRWTTDEEFARMMWTAFNGTPQSDFWYVLLRRYVSEAETVLPVDG